MERDKLRHYTREHQEWNVKITRVTVTSQDARCYEREAYVVSIVCVKKMKSNQFLPRSCGSGFLFNDTSVRLSLLFDLFIAIDKTI